MGVEGKYEVSNTGLVKSLIHKWGKRLIPKIMSLMSDELGYKRVSIRKNGRTYTFLVHRLVAIAFIPNPENKPQINHKNGIPSDINVGNLEWCSDLENKIHASKNFLNAHGETHGMHKVTEKDVREIRLLRKNSHMLYADIGKLFGVTWGTVRHICIRHTWKWVV